MKTLVNKFNTNNIRSFVFKKYVKLFFSEYFNKKPSECFYKTLHCSPNSHYDDIKKEYYKLAKKYHPDNFHAESKDNQSVSILFKLNKFKRTNLK